MIFVQEMIRRDYKMIKNDNKHDNPSGNLSKNDHENENKMVK